MVQGGSLGGLDLLFLRVDCECNRPPLFATVFYDASAFNGDLNQWDVANVTDMFQSKSIRMLEYVFATVFYDASAFNGDLNQWDVANVTDMFDVT